MQLSEAYERSKESLARIGESVRAEARATGTPISYYDPAYKDAAIREYPDGRRECIGADGVVTSIPSRAG